MVEKIIRISGTAIPIPGNNIDTDTITPSGSMKSLDYTNESLGVFLFSNERKKYQNHPLNDPKYGGASIMIVGGNFACGSSRETAPQAINRHGIQAIVGESYAGIFESTCKNLGMAAVTTSPEDLSDLATNTRDNPNTVYVIDLESMTLDYNGKRIQIAMPTSSRAALIEGKWDAVEMLENNLPQIKLMPSKLPYVNGFAN